MDRIELFNRLKRERRSAISPIIATLLLILIAIAAGVVVYAYVLGFVGNSTSNSGNNTSVISIPNFCISASTNCNAVAYYVSVQNTGSVSIPSGGNIQLYFSDITSGSSSVVTCTLASALSPTSTVSIPIASSCSGGPTGSLPSVLAGQTVSVKVVAPDGGTATSSTKVIS
jgi:flagellin-like protein